MDAQRPEAVSHFERILCIKPIQFVSVFAQSSIGEAGWEIAIVLISLKTEVLQGLITAVGHLCMRCGLGRGPFTGNDSLLKSGINAMRQNSGPLSR